MTTWPTLLSKKANNWVDRGAPPDRVMRHVLAHFFERFDLAERVLRGDVPANVPTADSLSHWMASRLLTPDQLAQFERDGESDSPYA